MILDFEDFARRFTVKNQVFLWTRSWKKWQTTFLWTVYHKIHFPCTSTLSFGLLFRKSRVSRDEMFHSQLAFLKTCSMLFLQVKCSNLLFRLLISKATAAGLENQLEVNFARARRSSLHLPIKRLGTELAGYAGFWAVCKSPWWDNYLCRRPNIDFKHKGRILQQIKDNPYKKHPTSNRISNGQVSKTIYMGPRISLKPTH